jgi:hypothetical protein
MFWVNRQAEANNKFKFRAIFSNFAYTEQTPNNGFGGVGLGQFGTVSETIAKTNLAFSVKKIDAPKLNIEFERAYANEYVHYFQNGPIHWEPINITFVDTTPIKEEPNNPNLNNFFFEYLRSLAYTHIDSIPGVEYSFQQNRTNLIDLPNFCDEIKIINDARFANENYPKGSSLFGMNQDDKFVNNRTGSIEQAIVSNSTVKQNVFVIHKPKLIKIDLGSFDYGSDEINEISITVVPEWCSYTDKST